MLLGCKISVDFCFENELSMTRFVLSLNKSLIDRSIRFFGRFFSWVVVSAFASSWKRRFSFVDWKNFTEFLEENFFRRSKSIIFKMIFSLEFSSLFVTIRVKFSTNKFSKAKNIENSFSSNFSQKFWSHSPTKFDKTPIVFFEHRLMKEKKRFSFFLRFTFIERIKVKCWSVTMRSLSSSTWT